MKYSGLFLIFFFTFSSIISQPKKHELVLVGTMHQVSGIVKNSYKPLYKKSLAYRPEAIFVEYSMPDDSLSWDYLKNGYSKSSQAFFKYSNKIKSSYNFKPEHFDSLLALPFHQLKKPDYDSLLLSFAYLRDEANYYYYQYLDSYYPDGHKKSKRNENYELTRKLALELQHKKVYAADDQQTNGEFHRYWNACDDSIQGTAYARREKRIIRKLVLREVFPSIVGRYGIVNNKPKHLQLLDSLSALRYTNQAICDCAAAVNYFDQRNQRFANNLGTQIIQNNFSKSILFVGAAHIVGLRKELEQQFPEIQITLFDEL
ncbi:DUF5694 domain-containing protein [uncultured Draconibacterium sp.]|uniref:DUF5694 domain-containing protein n=1 Tax=uncultured Draconibacterium sp. TaxID=1573823 RepID=UPI0032604C2A